MRGIQLGKVKFFAGKAMSEEAPKNAIGVLAPYIGQEEEGDKQIGAIFIDGDSVLFCPSDKVNYTSQTMSAISDFMKELAKKRFFVRGKAIIENKKRRN